MMFASSLPLSVLEAPLGLPYFLRKDLTAEIGGFLSAKGNAQLCLVHASVISR